MELKFKLCISNENYEASLEKGKVYRTIPDKEAKNHNLIRIIDESGEDYLYPMEIFSDVKIPKSAEKLLVA